MFTQLKNLNLERSEVDELIALLVFAESMIPKYEEKGVEVPEWLVDRIQVLDREITDRNRDAVMSEIRRAESQLEAMKSPTEKKAALQTRLNKLKKQLVVK